MIYRRLTEMENITDKNEAEDRCGICGRSALDGRYGEYVYGFYRSKSSTTTQWDLVPSAIFKTEYYEIPLGNGRQFLCTDCIREKLRRSILAPFLFPLIVALFIVVGSYLFRYWEDAGWIVLAGIIVGPIILIRSVWIAFRNYVGNKYSLAETARIDSLAADVVRENLRKQYEYLKPEDEKPEEYDPSGLRKWQFEVRPVHPDIE